MGLASKMTRYGGRATSLGLVAGGVVVVAGVAMLATVFLGRPGVSVSSSGKALVQVHLSGAGTELTGLSATAKGGRWPWLVTAMAWCPRLASPRDGQCGSP